MTPGSGRVPMRIAFLMDPLESIDPVNETTSHLMYECNQRGHTVYFLEPHDLYVRDNSVVARMRDVTVAPDLSMRKYWRATIGCVKRAERIYEIVTDLDVLFLRKNPPLAYQAMEFLSPVENRVFVINSTVGQILANSKLYAMNFPDMIPETHVSRDPARLRKVIDDFGGAMVVKPIQRYGGEGVIKVSVKDRQNLNSLIDFYVRASHDYPQRDAIMVQEYLDAARLEGDTRILLLDGEVLGAMRRQPQTGDFRANIHAGARAHKHAVTAEELQLCTAIRDKLVGDGLYFVGIDIIGGKLIEINCVSPGGIPRINRLDDVRLESKVIDFVERKALELGERNGFVRKP